MKSKALHNYMKATIAFVCMIALGFLPHAFLSTKDATVLQFLYYYLIIGIVVLLTIFIGITRLADKDFQKNQFVYCFLGISNVVIPLAAIVMIFSIGFSFLFISLICLLFIGIAINGDIIRTIKLDA